METPLTDVAIPTGFHLTDQDDFLPLDVNPHPQEVSRIRSGIKNCLGWSWTQTESWCDIRSGRLNHTFLILPIAVRAAATWIVLDVEDRNVSAVKHSLAAIIYISKFNARAIRS